MEKSKGGRKKGGVPNKLDYERTNVWVPKELVPAIKELVQRWKEESSFEPLQGKKPESCLQIEEMKKKVEDLEEDNLKLRQFVDECLDKLNECILDNTELERKLGQLSKTTR